MRWRHDEITMGMIHDKDNVRKDETLLDSPACHFTANDILKHQSIKKSFPIVTENISVACSFPTSF